MNIQEATKLALLEGKFITRRGLPNGGRMKIQPTDGAGCCIASPIDNSFEPRGGWQPSTSDLLADDWEIIDGGYGEHKTAKIRGIIIEL